MSLKNLFDSIETQIVAACDEYETSAPTVYTWLNDLYARLMATGDDVVLSELSMVERLKEDGQWYQPNYAANAVYKLLDRLGRDTTGQAGF